MAPSTKIRPTSNTDLLRRCFVRVPPLPTPSSPPTFTPPPSNSSQTRHRDNRAPNNNAPVRNHVRLALLYGARTRLLHDPHPSGPVLFLRRASCKQSGKIEGDRSRSGGVWHWRCGGSEFCEIGDADCWAGCEGDW